jgi:hypothetical protein
MKFMFHLGCNGRPSYHIKSRGAVLPASIIRVPLPLPLSIAVSNNKDTYVMDTPVFYKTTIFPMVLYGCETWSVTLREELTCILRMFENRMLRGTFRRKWDEIVRGWRKTVVLYLQRVS